MPITFDFAALVGFTYSLLVPGAITPAEIWNDAFHLFFSTAVYLFFPTSPLYIDGNAIQQGVSPFS